MTLEYEPTISYEQVLAKDLQNKDFAVAYLNECLQEEEDITVFLLALRRVIEAQDIKISQIAKQSGLNRESLYKMLSEKGNPEWKSIKTILKTLGFKIQVAS